MTASTTLLRPDVSTEEIARRYVAGESLMRIARSLGCAERTVYLRLQKAGVETRPVARKPTSSYSAGHQRVKTDRGRPSQCSHCGTTDPSKRYEWASVSHDYGNPNDYIRLCYECHRTYDDVAARVSATLMGRPRPDLAGSRHPNAKLTESDVVIIRSRHDAGMSKAAIAREFGVSHSTISHIVHGLSWGHVA